MSEPHTTPTKDVAHSSKKSLQPKDVHQLACLFLGEHAQQEHIDSMTAALCNIAESDDAPELSHALHELLKKHSDQHHAMFQAVTHTTATSTPSATTDGHHVGLMHAHTATDVVDSAKNSLFNLWNWVRGFNDEGALFRAGKYTNTDAAWSAALLIWGANYLLYPFIPFRVNPAIIAIDNAVRLGVVGDWGTGKFGKKPENGAFLRVKNVVESNHYSYTIHLGDVYYAGSDIEEKANFLDYWPVPAEAADPATPGRSFALNSNHEMYSMTGYFNEALGHVNFRAQQETSYFCLYNDNWLIFGLDSAYASDKDNMFMDGRLNQPQVDFIRQVRAQHPPEKRVIIMTHHDPITLKGNDFKPFFQEVVDALNGRCPDYWYYGHVHNGIVYKDNILGISTKFRCAGHGAVPYGQTPDLAESDAVAWYEHELAHDKYIKERVRNGYVAISLDGPKLSEQWICELGEVRFSLPQADQ